MSRKKTGNRSIYHVSLHCYEVGALVDARVFPPKSKKKRLPDIPLFRYLRCGDDGHSCESGEMQRYQLDSKAYHRRCHVKYYDSFDEAYTGYRMEILWLNGALSQYANGTAYWYKRKYWVKGEPDCEAPWGPFVLHNYTYEQFHLASRSRALGATVYRQVPLDKW